MIGDKHEFHDVSAEMFRVYEFPGTNGETTKVRINQPVKLAVSERHSHRIVDANGTAHYIPPGWVHLSWEVKPGKEPFVV